MLGIGGFQSAKTLESKIT